MRTTLYLVLGLEQDCSGAEDWCLHGVTREAARALSMLCDLRALGIQARVVRKPITP